VRVSPESKAVVLHQSRMLSLRASLQPRIRTRPACKIIPVQLQVRHQQHGAEHGIIQQRHVVRPVLLPLANGPFIPSSLFFLVPSRVACMTESSYVPTVVKEISGTVNRIKLSSTKKNL
jgi:hypothetical protein